MPNDVYSRIKNVDIVTKETQTPYSYFTDELIDQVGIRLPGYRYRRLPSGWYAGRPHHLL